ncbi:MAG: DUF1566 domain-containing protein [Candidatus Binatia bacterium]
MRVARHLVLGVLASIVPAIAAAQTPNLKCYTIRDSLGLRGMADLDTAQFGLDPGCKISSAKRFCVPEYTGFSGPLHDKDTDLPITRLILSRPPQTTDQVCYKVKCPAAVTNPDQVVTDEFGSRTVKLSKAQWLCAPAVKGTAYCGDGTIQPGEQCESTDLGGASCTSLGYAAGTLACGSGCRFDASACVSYPTPGSCGNGTVETDERCDGVDLGGASCASLGYSGGTLACRAWCAFDTRECTRTYPGTGQTTCWNGPGAAVPCAGTGYDGDVQAGAPLSYTDNGDGTITDTNTTLVWEKLSDDGSMHDKDDTYTWPNAFAVKVAALNTIPCFAGHCDWRLPNWREIGSLQNLGVFPSVSPEFDSACAPGCTVLTCSCTAIGPNYWSSTTDLSAPSTAVVASFGVGLTGAGGIPKSTGFRVRAVRGGT